MWADQDQADPHCPFDIINDDSALLIFNKCNFNDQCSLKLAINRACFKSISVHDFMRDHTQCTIANIVALAVMNERQDVIDALQNNYGEISQFKECLSRAKVYNLKCKDSEPKMQMHEDEIINSTWTPDAPFLVGQIEKAGGLTDSEFKHLSLWLPSEMPNLPANLPHHQLEILRMHSTKIRDAKTKFLISLVDALLLSQRVNILGIAMKVILQCGPYIESSTYNTLQQRYFATAVWISYENAVHPCLRRESFWGEDSLYSTTTAFSSFDKFDTEAYNEVVNFFIFLTERRFKKLPDSLELKQRSAGIQLWIRRCFVTEYILVDAWMKSSGSPIDGIDYELSADRDAFFLRVARMGFSHGCVDAFIEKRMHEVWREGGAFSTDVARENDFLENEFTPYLSGRGGDWINFKAYAWAVHSILLRNHPSTWPEDFLIFMLRHSSHDEDGLIKVVQKGKEKGKESIFPSVASTAVEIAGQPSLSVLARSKLLKAIEGLSLQELKPFGLPQSVATTKRRVASFALMSGDQAFLSWAKERGISEQDFTDAIQSNIQLLSFLIEGASGDRIVASALYNADSDRHERGVKPTYYVDEVDFAVKWEDVAPFALRAGTRALPLVFSYALDNHLYIQSRMLEGARSWTTVEMLIKHFRIPASMFRLGHMTSHLKCSTERATLRRLIPTLATSCNFGDEWGLARSLAMSGVFDLAKLFLSKVA